MRREMENELLQAVAELQRLLIGYVNVSFHIPKNYHLKDLMNITI